MDETQPLMLQRSRAAAIPLGGPLLGGHGGATAAPPLARAFKGAASECISIDELGNTNYVPMRKARLVSELGLRHRDIRALEPGVLLPYPAAIFVRKQALILNLEGLKVIISQDRALVISVPPLETLSDRLKPTLESPVILKMATIIALKQTEAVIMQNEGAANGTNPDGTTSLSRPPSVAGLDDQRNASSGELPFEVRALEAVLLTSITILGREVAGLEGTVLNLLSRIRRRVERNDIESLFEAQSRLDRAVGRVNRIKEVLEELLDDESSMEAMCLSRPEPATAPGGGGGSGSLGDGGVASPVSCSGGGAAAAAFGGSPTTSLKSWGEQKEQAENEVDEEVSEVEDLLEAHWLQSDYLLSRLQSLQQSISRTQHLVNLDLDSKRNALVALGVVIDVVLMAFELHMTITAVLGMNMTSGLERFEPYSVWAIAAIATVLGASVALLTLRWVRSRGLLFLPSFGLGSGGASGP